MWAELNCSQKDEGNSYEKNDNWKYRKQLIKKSESETWVLDAFLFDLWSGIFGSENIASSLRKGLLVLKEKVYNFSLKTKNWTDAYFSNITI